MCCIVKMHLACRNIIVLCKVLWWLNATQINPWMKMKEIHSVSASFYLSVATQILFNNLLEQHLYLKFLYYKVNWCTKFRVMTKVPSDLEQTWEKNKLSVTNHGKWKGFQQRTRNSGSIFFSCKMTFGIFHRGSIF